MEINSLKMEYIVAIQNEFSQIRWKAKEPWWIIDGPTKWNCTGFENSSQSFAVDIS